LKQIRTLSQNNTLIEERRNHIINCAIKVFSSKGYRGTTMRDLAKTCRMSEGGLYRYIGSKDDIIHLICATKATGSAQLEKFLSTLGETTPPDALTSCLKNQIQAGEKNRQFNMFFNREIHYFSASDRRMLLEDQVAMVHFYEKLLIKGIESGEFQIESPLMMAHEILMKVHNWVMRRWFLIQHYTLEEYINIQTDIILKAIEVDSKNHI